MDEDLENRTENFPLIKSTISSTKKIRLFLLDMLFPVACLGCGSPHEWLCAECLSKIPPKKEQFCPICEKKITPNGEVCFSCGQDGVDGLLVAASYKIPEIARLIHYFKYRFVENMRVPLGKILSNAFIASGLPIPDLIVPVPLHKKRLRWRGFNQSELLANYLAEHIAPGYKIPVLNRAVTRSKNTLAQMRIRNYRQRKENLKNSFSLSIIYPGTMSEIKGRKILLVDDVATTGTTLSECAKALKTGGAREVMAAVIARQEMEK